MTFLPLARLAATALTFAVLAVAQEPAVLTRHAVAPQAPAVAMRHGGVHLLPATVVAKVAAPASHGRVAAVRVLPVHFRH
ncbi:MAG: hypothetical protein JNK15_01745 [Planctomycetes bacterium]|nr:hypothetical protein [Planctomycetota bacterium]